MTVAEKFELETLREERSKEREESRAVAEQQYVELVQAVAQGFEIDADCGEQVIAACGKTVEDFARDLAPLTALYSQRRLQEATWHATVHACQVN
jgi:hypothetical protein